MFPIRIAVTENTNCWSSSTPPCPTILFTQSSLFSINPEPGRRFSQQKIFTVAWNPLSSPPQWRPFPTPHQPSLQLLLYFPCNSDPLGLRLFQPHFVCCRIAPLRPNSGPTALLRPRNFLVLTKIKALA